MWRHPSRKNENKQSPGFTYKSAKSAACLGIYRRRVGTSREDTGASTTFSSIPLRFCILSPYRFYTRTSKPLSCSVQPATASGMGVSVSFPAGSFSVCLIREEITPLAFQNWCFCSTFVFLFIEDRIGGCHLLANLPQAVFGTLKHPGQHALFPQNIPPVIFE
ncbi:uncharacterized protein LOC126409894 [Nymphaea colorata]|uniref:uncharacterized protein LOC126409894 n=1 Tax=Nymphaea colorata TaxID=210225 RepID=UPI00214EDE46|nr:uncharacterized protein LOC126409894 [Nymphaea colorata]